MIAQGPEANRYTYGDKIEIVNYGHMIIIAGKPVNL